MVRSQSDSPHSLGTIGGMKLRNTSAGGRKRIWFHGSVAATMLVLLGTLGPVTLRASGSPVPRMPNVVGLSRAQTYSVMRAHNLFFVTSGIGSSDGSWQFVQHQSPAAGAPAPVKSNTYLVVNKIVPGGPRPMPRLVGLSHSAALAVLRTNGLSFQVSGPGSVSNTWGRVLGQSPPVRTIVQWHAHVKLAVTLVRKPVTPTTAHPTTTMPATTTTESSSTTSTTAPDSSTTTTDASSTTLPTTAAVITPYGGLPKYKRVFETFRPLARSTSGNQVLVRTLSPKICATHKNVLTFMWPGTCVFQFRDPGSANFLPAQPITRRIPVDHQAVGQATFYSYNPGYCASHYVQLYPGDPPRKFWFPYDTLLKVTNQANHISIYCRVTDHEQGGQPHVVDLSMTQFAQLMGRPGDFAAIYAVGVLNVIITW